MLPSPDALPEEQMRQAEEINVLRAALQQLTDEQQTIISLRFIERKSHEEVAALTGKSVAAVKSVQHRALKQLAKHLGLKHKARHYLRGGEDS